MREIDAAEWNLKQNKLYSEKLKLQKTRSPRRRPIPKDKEQILFRIAQAKKKKMLLDGTIKLVGPRNYEVTISRF